jgi:oligoribonuclease (3'-5' exoribonuclease)
MLIWCDCETTGLDPTIDSPIEVGLGITDDDLNLKLLTSWLITPVLDQAIWPELVVQMHTDNGLLNDLATRPTCDFEQVEEEFVFHVEQWMANYGITEKMPLCGSTIGFDRAVITQWLPGLLSHVSYRSVDVSSIKELVNRWYPLIAAARPNKDNKAHRAMSDIVASIEELKYYRDEVFRLEDYEVMYLAD